MGIQRATLRRVLLAVFIGALVAPTGAWAAGPRTTPSPVSSSSPPVARHEPPGVRAAGGAIVVPKDGEVFATVIAASTAATNDFGLDQPSHALLIEDATNRVTTTVSVGTFATGTSLVFYVYNRNDATTFLSTSDHAQVTSDMPGSWKIAFEDWTDMDFNDLIVHVYVEMPGESVPPAMGPRVNGNDAGDPVQTFVGAFTYRHTDIAIGGAGSTPTFIRSYDSADTRIGPLGPGWTDNYAVRLRDPGDASGDILFVGPDGTTVRFTRNPDGTFSPPPGVTLRLVRNWDASYGLTDRSKTRWTFSPVGFLTSIADNDSGLWYIGLSSVLTYDDALRLASISDPGGRGSLTLGYDTSGRLATITDWASPPRTVSFGYDVLGRLATVTDREGKTTTYGYDGTSARLTTISDARGHTALTLTYDASGRVATQTDARGLITGDVTTFDYVDNPDRSRVTTVTYPATSFEPSFHPTIQDTYTADGWIVSRVRRPSSTETLTDSYAYDTSGFRTSVTDPAGATTDYCYDVDYAGGPVAGSRGNLTRRIGPPPTPGAARPVTLIAYDTADLPTQVVPPRGVVSGSATSCSTDLSASINTAFALDLRYDPWFGVLSDMTRHYTDPERGAMTARTGNDYAGGLLVRSSSPRSFDPADPAAYTHAEYTYAADFTLASYREPGGTRGYTSWDPVGRFTALRRPSDTGNVTYAYDNEDRLRFARDPWPTVGAPQLVTEYRYDEVGNPVVRIAATGQVTKYVYDERDALIEVHENPGTWTDPAVEPPGTTVTRYAYDAAGHVTRMVRASGDPSAERATDYTYDGRGLLRSETEYPAWPAVTPALVRTYTYGPDGQLVTAIDPNGVTTTYAYDALGRLTSIAYSDSATRGVTYTYDANGNRSSMTDGTGTTTYTYDETDRLLSIAAPGGIVGYRHSLDGETTKVIYPDATSVTYGYDSADRLTTVTDWAARTTSYTYTPDDLVASVTGIDGVTTDYIYDGARRLTGITVRLGTTLLDRRAYALDPLGNVVGVTSGNETRLVSTTGAGATGDGASSDPDISGDGRYVAFTSAATNLVSGDTNGKADVFVRDRQTGTTTRVSMSSSGAQGNGASDQPSISADGRYVAFRSAATNLVTGDTNAKTDIFVKDLQTGTLTRASVSSSGAQSNNTSDSPAISGDGRYVAFASPATNLVTGDTNAKADVFLRDRQANTTTRLSVSTLGAQANNTSESPDISEDGTRIVFSSTATNLVTGDTNAKRDVFLRDRGVNTTTRLSVSSTGAQANNVSELPVISGGGSAVAFESTATNLVAGGTAALRNIFVRRIAAATTELVSLAEDVPGYPDRQLYYAASSASISSTGALVGFSTLDFATPEDTSYAADVFVRDTTTSTTTLVSVGTLGEAGSDASTASGISSTGAVVAFVSAATEFAPGDSNAATDVFARASLGDSSTYTYDRLSRLTGSTEPVLGSTTYAYDPVGNRVSRTRGTSTSYTYDRADRLTSVGGVGVTVDAGGNLVARSADTFGYDGANRLVIANVGSLTETYTYDGDGNRVGRTSGATTIPYVLDVNNALPVVLSDDTRKYVWGKGLLYAATGSAVEVVHADRLGSVRALTDASGAVTATYRTDAYGIPTASTGSSGQPFGFTGEPVDATGLVDLRARMYDPSTGRFMSRDSWPGSMTRPTSLDRYVYAGDNPATWSDPSGRCLQFLALAVLGPPGAAAAVGISAGCAAALMLGGAAMGVGLYAAVGPKPAQLTPAGFHNPVVDQGAPGGDRIKCLRSGANKVLCAAIVAALLNYWRSGQPDPDDRDALQPKVSITQEGRPGGAKPRVLRETVAR